MAFVPGADFMLEGGENSLRLSFASVPPEQIPEGVARIARGAGAGARREPGVNPQAVAAAAGTRRLGFESLEEEVGVDRIEVSGELPAWLAGSLVRVTPAMLDVGGKPLRHWFDGLAMLNAFSFEDGTVGYGSRFLRTEAYRKARAGSFDVPGFAQDPCRSLFKRVTSMFSGPRNDNTNVNLTRLGERYVALTELPLPVEFDPGTLETVGVIEWKDKLGGQVTTAHPHLDRDTGEFVNYVAHFGRRTQYRVFGVAPGSTSRRQIAAIPVREPAYMQASGSASATRCWSSSRSSSTRCASRPAGSPGARSSTTTSGSRSAAHGSCSSIAAAASCAGRSRPSRSSASTT